MKRTQRTITIMLLALLIGMAISATVYAAPQRPPRRTDEQRRAECAAAGLEVVDDDHALHLQQP